MILRPIIGEPQMPPGYPLPELPSSLRRYFEWIEYEPYRPWQHLYCAAICQYRFVLWLSGARGGKSDPSGKMGPYLCLMKPKTRGWIYGSSYDSAEKEFLYAAQIVEELIPKRIKGFTPRIIHAPKAGNMLIEFPNGSWIKAMSAESAKTGKSGKGEELDFLNICESADIPFGVWKRILNYRITSRIGRVFGGTTPEGFNWLNNVFFGKSGGDPTKSGNIGAVWPGMGPRMAQVLRRLDNPFDGKEIPGFPESYFTMVSPAFASPYYPPEEHDRHLREDDEADYQEQVLGIMVSRQGLVIRWLVPGQSVLSDSEVVRRFSWHTHDDPPSHWKRIVAMDYGDAKPKATLIGAIHPANECVVWYWEFYDSRSLVADQVRAAKRKLGWHADRSETRWIIDKSAPRKEYAEAGAPVTPSQNFPGQKRNIWATSNRMLRDGRCFVVGSQVPKFLWEASNFRYKPDSERSSADERDAVVKRDDHLCDAFGYGNDILSEELEAPKILVEVEEVPWPPLFDPRPSKPQTPPITDEMVRGLIFG